MFKKINNVNVMFKLILFTSLDRIGTKVIFSSLTKYYASIAETI